ncbi:MAG: hypothetical protein JWN48_696 [Myxococcaceae bacterium]|nr:hypothetical protein [Myxococcaceae bacterium]
MLLVSCLWAGPALGQHAPDPGHELQLIESTERDEDPLGIDDSTGKELDRAAARLPKPKPVVFLPTPGQGAALSAIAGLRESAHDVNIELAQGLAFVKVRFTLSSSVKHAAEVAYRLPLPASGVVTRVRTCAGPTCSDALPVVPGPEPSRAAEARDSARARSFTAIDAELIEDARGRALGLRIAPIAPGASVTAEVEYVAEAPCRGGRARFRLEPRGYDPNLAATHLRAEATRGWELSPAAELSVDPWTPIELSASLPAGARPVRVSTSAPCGPGRCRRDYEATARAPAPLRTTWLFIDASPSMEGPARSRLSVALAALLSVLPESSALSAWAFGARASELGRFQAGAAPLLQLADATLLDLDAASMPSAAFALVHKEIPRVKPRIVVLSDGLFDTSQREREALAQASRLGAETWLVALGDVEPRLTELFQHTLQLGPIAEAASHGGDLSALEDALAAISEKTLANGQRAGEQRVREQRPRAGWPLAAGSPWLSFWLQRDRPLSFHSEARGDSSFIAALPYETVQRPAPAVDTGLPKESVLSMLRTQLVPAARACLRSDRKGRANYAVGLAFHASFGQREVYDAEVVGAITRELRGCLEAIMPKLRVPAFSGRIRIRYPIHTEREEEPPVIELEPEVSRQLERAFSGARALP